MAPKIATLGEALCAELAHEWPLSGMLAEVISQVTAFLEYIVATRQLALKIELNALVLSILNLDSLVPLI